MKDSFYKKVMNDPRLNDVPILFIIKVIDIIEFLKAEEKNDKGITESEWATANESIYKYEQLHKEGL